MAGLPTSFLIGTAASVSGSTVSVKLQDGTEISVRKDSNLTVAVGDGVRLARLAGAQWVSANLGPAPAPEPISGGDDSVTPTPPAPSTVVSGETPITPVSTGTIRNGSRRPDTADLYQGDWKGTGLNFGCAWYGTRIKDLRGTLQSGSRLQINRGEGGVFGAQTPTICLLSGTTWPGSGTPTILASAAGPSLAVDRSALWSIPSGWFPQLDSGDAGGFGIWVNSRTPYVHLLTAGDGMTFIGNWKE